MKSVKKTMKNGPKTMKNGPENEERPTLAFFEKKKIKSKREASLSLSQEFLGNFTGNFIFSKKNARKAEVLYA